MLQFRTAIHTPNADAPCRLHLIHAPSPHPHAVPLLLIPPFPFTNLALAHVVALFTEPADAAAQQPFHLVIPSLPGMGFSHGLGDGTRMIPTTAAMLDTLMRRLGYAAYLVTNSGPSVEALPPVDWRLANHLATHFPDSCLGAHFLAPPLSPPAPRDSLLAWAKWTLVSTLGRPMLGYSRQDVEALRRGRPPPPPRPPPAPCHASTAPPGFGSHGEYEPNTLAYALCDSPLGIVLLILMVVRILGPNEEMASADIVNMTALTWLPGPEGTMRMWAHCASCPDDPPAAAGSAPRPRVAMTVFLGDGCDGADDADGRAAGLPRRSAHSYVCPAWASARYQVVATKRVPGRPGMLAWERPGVLAAGARALAKAVLAVDKRLAPRREHVPAPLEKVVVDGYALPPKADGCTRDMRGGSDDDLDWPVTPTGTASTGTSWLDGDGASSYGSPETVVAVEERPLAAA